MTWWQKLNHRHTSWGVGGGGVAPPPKKKIWAVHFLGNVTRHFSCFTLVVIYLSNGIVSSASDTRWCHCHSLSLSSVKCRLALPFRYRLTQVIPDNIQTAIKWLCVCVWRLTSYATNVISTPQIHKNTSQVTATDDTHTHTHTHKHRNVSLTLYYRVMLYCSICHRYVCMCVHHMPVFY